MSSGQTSVLGNAQAVIEKATADLTLQSLSRQMRFALRSLSRDLRLGELRVLALALTVAVASVTAVGFFTDRIGRAVERQAADVLAADLLASSAFRIPQSLLDEVKALELTTAQHVRFPSVVINERDESQLVAMKAVSDTYPLRGALRVANIDNPAAALSDAPSAPSPGAVWVDAQLHSALALQAGDVLTLGEMDFDVSHVILFEPDRGENAFEFAPRAMINLADLEASALLGAHTVSPDYS